MDSGHESVDDVYGLLGHLCESVYKQHRSQEQSLYRHPGEPADEQQNHLRRLRARAYEILLNKDGRHGDDVIQDPIVELLKHVYVMKVGAGKVSQAEELQNYLDEFIDEELEQDSVIFSTLVFLNSLKSLETQDNNSLDIFHYGKPHPQLPEMLHDEHGVPPFQVYPIESFSLPNKFESTLNQDYSDTVKYSVVEPGSKLTLLGRLTPSSDGTKKAVSNYSNIESSTLLKIPRCPTDLNGMELTLSSYFAPQIKDVERIEDQLQTCREGIVTEPESPWQSQDPLELFAQRNLNTRNDQTEICELEEDDPGVGIADLDEIWENMDKYSPPPSHRTWETLGSVDPPKEPPFVSESVEATLHVMNVLQDGALTKKSKGHEYHEIPSKKFLTHIKLLLLGVGSDSFHFNSSSGFSLKKNIMIHGISSGTLENLCYEVIRWGNCFRNLSDLIALDPLTGKLQMEGLIFKALCHSIKEFLLFYHAAILRISIDDDGHAGLLKYLSNVRPLGNLILKVAGLCRCEDQTLTSLGEGIGILTHIYKEVTKVTEPNVALVFYSILKDCCEAYFGFLQQWIFEGGCIDIYEEFMMKLRPQYLRTRTHRFWTRGFSINQQCVPGFLSGLTDTILQCGKAVSLLRICDPQNPLCRVSASSQPPVRVCLSVGMLREQNQFYQNYTIKGVMEQGESVTMHSAIQEEKENEKKRAELVMAAQEETLLRLKREREEALREILHQKHKLLDQLRQQAKEVAERKEKAKDAELLADKILLENIQKYEEEIQNIERIERENTIKYYNELAEDAKKRRIHADWRIKRMNLFDERVMSISKFRRQFVATPTSTSSEIEIRNMNQKAQSLWAGASDAMIDSDKRPAVQESKKDGSNVEKRCDPAVQSFEISGAIPVRRKTGENMSEDENKNSTPSTSITTDKSSMINQSNNVNEQNQNTDSAEEENGNTDAESRNRTRAVRPTVLDFANVTTRRSTNNNEKQDNLKGFSRETNVNLSSSGGTELTAAQRNRLKVLEQEFGFTPNNNESLSILSTKEISEGSQSNSTETEINRLRNTQHLTHLNWNDVETDGPPQKLDNCDTEQTETQLNRLRNTQHLTHLNWDNVQTDEPLQKLDDCDTEQTETQLNKLRNTQHLTHLNWDNVQTDEPLQKLDDCDTEQTEIQLNRLRNTKHLTHLNWDNVQTDEPLQKLDDCDTEQTEIQLNRLRNTQHLTHLNWDNVQTDEPLQKLDDCDTEKTEIQLNRLRNTQHLTHLNWDNVQTDEPLQKLDDCDTEKTEIQLNRLRNTQHLTHLNWDNVETDSPKKSGDRNTEQTEINRNRLRNTQHLTDFNYNVPEVKITSDNLPLTDAQLNRNKIMSHTYNQPEEFVNRVLLSENLTERQINKNRNLAHNTDQYDFDLPKISDPETAIETPMSTVTDYFTASNQSTSPQMQSCVNTPFSEITTHSDTMFAKSSDGGRSTDELASQDKSCSVKGGYFQDTPAFPHFIGLGSLPSSPTPERNARLTIADVEMIDTTSLQVYLEKSVVIPLTAQSRLVNSALIKYLLNEHKLLSHLHSLRSFFFLLNGEFAKTLTQSLFTRLYEASAPVDLFNSTTLSNFLEKALVSSLSSTYANSELLSLSATEVPPCLQTSNPEILNYLSLDYKISWPLNIIFSEVVMQQYSKVFKFLLMVSRVFWVLQQDFHILKVARTTSISKNHHKLQLYRHSMMQFMNALHTYLTCSVLHASWSEFEKELESATTLDEVCETHVRYIKKILSRCMLNVRGEGMRTCLCNIFRVVLKFHNRIRACNWGGGGNTRHANPNYDNLERMYVTFCEQRAYLAHVAEKLARSGYQPHLMQFLLALNINHRYDLIQRK